MRAIVVTSLAAICAAGLPGCTNILPMMAPGVDAEPSISSEFPYESQYVEVLPAFGIHG